MVKITIDLEPKFHETLQVKAKENKRSMRNELLIIIENSLSKMPLNAEFEEKEEDKPFVKKIGNTEVSTLFMQK